MKDKYKYESLEELMNRVTEKKDKENQLKEKETKLKKHMLLTDKFKKIEVAFKLLCKQFNDSNKSNMSPSTQEELMLNIQDQKKLKNSMEKVLAQIHHDSSDVSQ